MVNIPRLLTSYLAAQAPLEQPHDAPANKSVAIIGAGTAGLAMLNTLKTLPAPMREGLDFVAYEERERVGGVWLADDHSVTFPDIPKTPLYPRLHTNTPIPHMTFPSFPFPKGTALYPDHSVIQAYIRSYAQRHNLYQHIQLKTKVEKAEWVGNNQQGHWKLSIIDNHGHLIYRRFDHLVVASGSFHRPRITEWNGQEAWLHSARDSSRPTKRIIHAVYYRKPEDYENLVVLVVGNGPSGRDIATQIAEFAAQTHFARRTDAHPIPDGVPVQLRPQVDHFTGEGAVFEDGTTLDPDVVIIATGYELRQPFLESSGELRVDTSIRGPNAATPDDLVTNLNYIFPLHRHILSLSAKYPTNALAFIGLPSLIAYAHSDIAQSLFAAYAFIRPDILPPRADLLQELAAEEAAIRAHHIDPYKNGHKMLSGFLASEYEDNLISFLEDMGQLPPGGPNFVEQWRRDLLEYDYLKRGWKRIEERGEAANWTRNVETEEDWANLMQHVNEWQRAWEDEQGIPFEVDADLDG